MRVDTPGSGGAGAQPDALACGGFRVSYDAGAAEVRTLPGSRRLHGGVVDAVLRGLDEAPRLLRETLQLLPPERPFDRVEVVLGQGALTAGEALPLGAGVIRLSLGEQVPPADAAALARHEALHLYLAAALQGGQRWSDPELAFADWIVRGIEGGLDAGLPRFHPPMPRLLEELPTSRAEVQRQLASVQAAPNAARRYFGERLFAALEQIDGAADRALYEQRGLWLVEAALGTHFIEAAGQLPLDAPAAVRPVVLDDWLLEYERHARELANPPAGAPHLWRLSAAGWSRDVAVRLSVAAQALQCDDHSFFAGERSQPGAEPRVWKSGGRVRLPLLPARAKVRPAPLHLFRAALRELPAADSARALGWVEDAARGDAAWFEARALWPRILARLIASGAPLPAAEPGDAPPVVQLMGGPREQVAEWLEAAAALRALLGEAAGWAPRVLEPTHAAALLEAPRAPSSIVLVHPAPLALDPTPLLQARALAARLPVRGALFLDSLGNGAAWERLPETARPLDPRYREERWTSGHGLSALEFVASVDNATQAGDCTTPLTHLLAITGLGLIECHYPVAG